MEITFEQLPKAVGQLYEEITFIKLKILELLAENQKPMENNLMSVDEIADYLHLSKATVYMKVSNNEIPFMKKGKRLYFCRDEINEWVKKGKVFNPTADSAEVKDLIRPRKLSKCG